MNKIRTYAYLMYTHTTHTYIIYRKYNFNTYIKIQLYVIVEYFYHATILMTIMINGIYQLINR